MPKIKKTAAKKAVVKKTQTQTTNFNPKSLSEKIQSDLKNKQSSMSLVLGALIVIVLGVLLYNYINKPNLPNTTTQSAQTQTGDVSKNALPGKYTVKAGDTLFKIAQNYYNDGYQFGLIVKANNIVDANNISVGQVLEIPKMTKATPTPSYTPTPSPTPTAAPVSDQTALNPASTSWGAPITGTTYTVVQGDWLSKIAGRAYGNIYAYQKIAQANNISNINEIEPGTVLKIPRN